MTTNELILALMNADASTWVDHRIGTTGAAEWACFREGDDRDVATWFATIDDALRAFAELLRGELEEVTRKSDADLQAIGDALAE